MALPRATTSTGATTCPDHAGQHLGGRSLPGLGTIPGLGHQEGGGDPTAFPLGLRLISKLDSVKWRWPWSICYNSTAIRQRRSARGRNVRARRWPSSVDGRIALYHPRSPLRGAGPRLQRHPHLRGLGRMNQAAKARGRGALRSRSGQRPCRGPYGGVSGRSPSIA
jgi:hypothetical protein